MAEPVAALKFLSKVGKHTAQPVNVIFGDEPFLKRQATEELLKAVTEGEDAEFGVRRFSGDSVAWREVADQLATVALFGGGSSVVVVADGDDFVSRERDALESYVAKPNTSGILLLSVQNWPKNTRLYKALAQTGLQINCKRPTERQLIDWIGRQAAERLDTKFAPGAAEQLLEIVGPELGRLDQELEKLALLADGNVTPELVREMVGGWRAKTAWDMLDAACAGNGRAALEQLERLIRAGEHPVAILAQISASLRRLGAAARLYVDAQNAGKRIALRAAIEQAGVPPYFVKKSEGQLKQLGRDRAGRLYQWLLAADLELKGAGSSADRARLVLELLIVQIAAPQDKLDFAHGTTNVFELV